MTRGSNVGARVKGFRHTASPAAGVMRAFDKLPPRIRRVLNYAPLEIAPQSVLAHLRRGRSPLVIVKSIKAMAAHQFGAQRRALRELAP